MKKKYNTMPESMKNMEMYGFNWMEFVVSVPFPLYIMTSYKSNGQPNACMQSWTTFTGGENGFFAIVSAVSKYGHLYQTLHETGDAVINFMSADLYDKCMSTIRNNGFGTDEIKSAGLTSSKADMVNAPMIDECFMNLECRFKWEKEISEGDRDGSTIYSWRCSYYERAGDVTAYIKQEETEREAKRQQNDTDGSIGFAKHEIFHWQNV